MTKHETVDQAWKASPHMLKQKKKGDEMAKTKAATRTAKKETPKTQAKKPKTLREAWLADREIRLLLDQELNIRRALPPDKQAEAEAIIKKYPVKG